MDNHNHNHHDHYHDHEHSLRSELFHHLPYAIFSVAFALSILSFLTLVFKHFLMQSVAQSGAKMLFHSFHFMHIVFAATGTLVTFRRFCKSLLPALLIGIWSPVIFCTLSDSILPYLGGRALGVAMSFHLCFVTELANVLPFLFVGIINGYVLSKHNQQHQRFYSLFSHFVHILISSLASTLYLVSHGFMDWYNDIGFVFLFIIIAVVIPCTLSDVVVPMAYARVARKDEKH